MANVRKINLGAIKKLANDLQNNTEDFSNQLKSVENSFLSLQEATEGHEKSAFGASATTIKRAGNNTKAEFEKMIRYLKSLENARVSSGLSSRSSGLSSLGQNQALGNNSVLPGNNSQNNASLGNLNSGVQGQPNFSNETDRLIAEKFKVEKDRADLAEQKAKFYENELNKTKNMREDDLRNFERGHHRDRRGYPDDDYGRGYPDDYRRDRYRDPFADEIEKRVDKLDKIKSDLSSKISELKNSSGSETSTTSSPAPISGSLGSGQLTPQSNMAKGLNGLGQDGQNSLFNKGFDGNLKAMSTEGLNDNQNAASDFKIGGDSKDFSDLDSMSDSELAAADDFDFGSLSQNVTAEKTDFSSPIDGTNSSKDENSVLKTAGLGALGLGALAAGGAAFYASRKNKKDDNEVDTNDEFAGEYKINKSDLDASNFTSW